MLEYVDAKEIFALQSTWCLRQLRLYTKFRSFQNGRKLVSTNVQLLLKGDRADLKGGKILQYGSSMENGKWHLGQNH